MRRLQYLLEAAAFALVAASAVWVWDLGLKAPACGMAVGLAMMVVGSIVARRR